MIRKFMSIASRHFANKPMNQKPFQSLSLVCVQHKVQSGLCLKTMQACHDSSGWVGAFIRGMIKHCNNTSLVNSELSCSTSKIYEKYVFRFTIAGIFQMSYTHIRKKTLFFFKKYETFICLPN